MENGFKSFLQALGSIQGVSEKTTRCQAVLNGILGDTLEAKNSRWAIPMKLLGEVRGGKLCIFVHGLCDSETAWRFSGDSNQTYGSLLDEELGYSPLYLRYNSGLHISTNGRRLAGLLREVFAKHSGSIKEIILVGHSMGGLVVRSACHYGRKARAAWVKRVRKIFLLGVPHLGTDWEKLGNLTSTILKNIPNPFTRGIAGLGNRRSAGIKDLRFGFLLDEDWQGRDCDSLWGDHRHHVPLLQGVDYYLIAAALAKQSENFLARYFGDGLVSSRSARGHSLLKSKTLPFTPANFRVIKGLSHTGLARHPLVYEQIKAWCR